MNLPYVKDGNLHIENACFPLKNFCFEAMVELAGPDKPLDIYLLENTNLVAFVFPNSLGDIQAYFLYKSWKFQEVTEEEGCFDFKGLQFTEIHFQLYESIQLKAFLEKYSDARFLECAGKKFAAFSRVFLAEIENDSVSSLWFINPKLLTTANQDPLYLKLRELFG